MNVLVTGGAGYIGSHTLFALIEAGHDVVVIDSLVNGHAEAVRRVGQLTDADIPLEVGDIRDGAFLGRVFEAHRPEAVIHFAGLKAVGESVEQPLLYHDVNVAGSRALLGAMDAADCGQIVFSSSATVYGEPRYLPYDEAHPTRPVNPYGQSKLMVEQMLGDWCAATPIRSAISLRYFNPVGAHPTGRIGEDPQSTPDNLMPFVAQVAVGRRPTLQIFGDDYDTRDGTGERDYVHVVDLARAHVLALDALEAQDEHEVINIGTGHGTTVRELIDAFQAASGQAIATKIAPRRAGDLPSFYAQAELARDRLGWQAEMGLAEMCRDTWAWQSRNPEGFEDG